MGEAHCEPRIPAFRGFGERRGRAEQPVVKVGFERDSCERGRELDVAARAAARHGERDPVHELCERRLFYLGGYGFPRHDGHISFLPTLGARRQRLQIRLRHRSDDGRRKRDQNHGQLKRGGAGCLQLRDQDHHRPHRHEPRRVDHHRGACRRAHQLACGGHPELAHQLQGDAEFYWHSLLPQLLARNAPARGILGIELRRVLRRDRRRHYPHRSERLGGLRLGDLHGRLEGLLLGALAPGAFEFHPDPVVRGQRSPQRAFLSGLREVRESGLPIRAWANQKLVRRAQH